MTEKELNDFEYLNDIFHIRCKAICQILRKLDRDYNTLDSFYIWEDDIYGEGENDEDRYTIRKRFPKKFIYAHDSEIETYVNDILKIETYVNDILKQRSEARKEKERIYKQNLEKRERDELARLKAKYGE